MDLERLFSVPSISAIAAHDVFTNRIIEKEAFRNAARKSAWEGSRPMELVLSPVLPRSNLLIYHGMGGIGKTTLSKELQRMFLSGEVDQCEQMISARVDFAELSALDTEVMLLRLRASFGLLAARFPAFDLALATYWERKHPGEPLAEFLSRSSSLGRFTSEVGVAEQIQNNVDNLMGGLGLAGTAWRLGHLLKDGVIKRINERRILRDCPYFEPLVSEPFPEKVLPFLPSLLAWDLANQQNESKIAAVVFFDTWEALQARPVEMGGLEDSMNRMIHLMPNVLFVVTGRNRLDWENESRASTIKYAGTNCWPHLASGANSAQFLVGGLSPSDSDEYLQLRLTVNDEPAIPEDFRRRIIAASEGMPLYLELSAEHYDLQAASGTPSLQDFGTSLPHLMTRVIRDLSAEERLLLRAAALVKAFDRYLLKAAIPSVGDAAVQRFLQRSFVRRDGQGWFQHSLHDTLRESVREFDSVSPDPWSEDEWRSAALRIVGHLEQLSSVDIQSSDEQNRIRLSECFLQACILGVNFDFVLPWLIELALALRGLGQWPAFEYLESFQSSMPLDFAPVGTACLGIYRRGIGYLPDAESLLRSSASSLVLPQSVRGRVDIELAEVLVRENRDAEAEVYLRTVADPNGPLSDRAESWLAVLNERRNKFVDAARWIGNPHPDEAILQFARNLEGHVLLASGRFAEAETEFRSARDLADRRRLAAEAGSMLEDEAWAACFASPVRGRRLAASSLEVSERFGMGISIGRSRARLALAMTWDAPVEDVLDQIRLSFDAIEAAGYHSDCVDPLLVEWLQYCLVGDLAKAIGTAQKLKQIVDSYHAHGYMLLVGMWWMRLAFPSDALPDLGSPQVDWLDDESTETVRQRWEGVLKSRLSAR